MLTTLTFDDPTNIVHIKATVYIIATPEKWMYTIKFSCTTFTRIEQKKTLIS